MISEVSGGADTNRMIAEVRGQWGADTNRMIAEVVWLLRSGLRVSLVRVTLGSTVL